MSARRKTELDKAPQDAESQSAVQLRTKYLDLCRKYSALVRRLDLRTAGLVKQRVSSQTAVYRLGYWALTATGTGLALVRKGTIVTRNARWNELDAGRGGWQRDAVMPAARYLHLSQAAIAEVAHLSEEGPTVAVRRYRAIDGDQVVEMRLERIDSAEGPVVVQAIDVTALVRNEEDLAHMREALLQSEHLAVLGELASSIAHDMGNTLRAMSTRIAVLAQDRAVSAAHAAVLEGLRESAEAALASVRKLHELARSGHLQPGPVDLADVLRHATEVLRLRQAPGAPPIEVRSELRDLPPVLGTASELSHVFITLLTNARDAMPTGGTINVRAERTRERVRVTVADEGTGIAAEHMTQLFRPFFTTKGEKGTGLGLWLAHSSLRRLGGSIAAHNRAAGGAEFVVELLLANEAGRVTPRRAPGRRRQRIARRG
jgi:C4-dicarboxylate-specific signal transduction histidine kinase